MAGEPLAVVASAADTAPREVPRGFVSSTRVADALGYPVAVAIEALAAGGVTVPVPDARGAWIVRVVDREPARVASFEEARDEVRVEWARARGGQ